MRCLYMRSLYGGPAIRGVKCPWASSVPGPQMSWAARGWQMNIRKLSRQNQSMKLQGSEMKPVAKLGNDVKAKIGQQLRLMYDEIVEQGVPERFAGILRDLDEPTDKGSENEPT